jgi:epoxyqueuosine reductase
MAALVQQLRRRGQQAGLAAIGVAPATPMEGTRRILQERKAAGLSATMQFTYRNPERSTDPGRLLPGAAALVVGAWAYGGRPATPGAATSTDGNGEAAPKGIVARYADRDHYADLKAALGDLAGVLHQAGFSARVVADDNALVDRAAAHRAGLGWFGKNANILLPRRGSWFLLGSVVTDAPLPADAPVDDGCGPCRRCLGSCPTGALVAPGVLDARRCLAWLLQAEGVFPFEYREALGARIYGCDDCQDTCPANRAAARLGPGGSANAGAANAGPVGPGEGAVDILDLLSTDDAALLARYGRWYIPRRDPRYLRRNALIVLANVGDGGAKGVEQALCHFLCGPDEMLRAHAVWAAVRVGRRDLLAQAQGLEDDQSPLVQHELRRLDEIEPRSPLLGAGAGAGARVTSRSSVVPGRD